jgi:1,4-alpha-glucan branching enzyme
MGCEFAQEREWNYEASLDWHLLDDPLHEGMKRLVRDLNLVYRAHPPLHELDCDPEGFEWIDASDSEQSVVSFLRKDRKGNPIVIVCNFTPVVRANYRVGVPIGGGWRELINSDAEIYGGSDIRNGEPIAAAELSWHGRPFSLDLTLPPLGALVLEPIRYAS